ncbi:MAG: hypothetical protein Q9190_006324 [Brigantiaea leucoxantha]
MDVRLDAQQTPLERATHHRSTRPSSTTNSKMVVDIMPTRKEKEKDRLDVMHSLVELSLGGRLHLAPVSRKTRKILDLGTGTGVWVMEMGMPLRISSSVCQGSGLTG